LDLYTINEQKGRLDNLNVAIGGDLANGRTARSLAKLLALYPDNHINFISVPELQIGEDIKTYLEDHNVSHEETVDMYDALRIADVVYWTRIQKERLENPEAVPAEGFVIDQTALEVLPEYAIIMHPLPRVDEIHQSVDQDPRAVYFRQAGNGMYVRMALIEKVLRDHRTQTQ
jgi:aspartate carbamoyltransferase catalytic subunit